MKNVVNCEDIEGFMKKISSAGVTQKSSHVGVLCVVYVCFCVCMYCVCMCVSEVASAELPKVYRACSFLSIFIELHV